MKTFHTIVLVAALVSGNARLVAAQSVPACYSRIDWSDNVEKIFAVLSDEQLAPIRDYNGIVRQSESAHRSVLRDNDMCAGLRATLRKELKQKDDEKSLENTELSFFVLGDYYAVLVRTIRQPCDVISSGTAPLYDFNRAMRLVLTTAY